VLIVFPEGGGRPPSVLPFYFGDEIEADFEFFSAKACDGELPLLTR